MRWLRYVLFVDLVLFGYSLWIFGSAIYLIHFAPRDPLMGHVAGGLLPLLGVLLFGITAIFLIRALFKKHEVS